MLSTDWAMLCAALVEIERLDEAASGLLSFGPAPNGGIFIERGRISWVAATGFERRLRDLLRLPSAEMDRVYETCRLEGRLLGQTLVEEGRIGPSEFEQALRRHSAECLIELCRAPKPLSWSPRSGRGYGASTRFTLASTSSAETLAVWWRDSLLFVVACDDRTSVAGVTAHHLSRP